MNRTRLTFVLAMLCIPALVLAQQAAVPDQQKANMAPDQGAIKGDMKVQYNTRTEAGTEEGAPKKGVQDVYTVNLTVNTNRMIQGTITRQPRIKQLKIRTVQWPKYEYNLSWAALVGGAPKVVGKWVGPMAVDEKTGAFILEGGGERALRISVDVGDHPFRDEFGGRFYGKAEDKSKLSLDSIKRTIAGKEVEKKFQSDPMRFENLILAEGPDQVRYPKCTVNGELTYDREEGNYYAKNLTFTYKDPIGSKDVTDKVTGTIKWVADPNRQVNGKGAYQFNLRFNEDAARQPAPEEKAFSGMTDEDLMFAVSPGIPALTGNVNYVDNFSGSVLKDADGNPQPVSSAITYDLGAHGLNKQQTMNFLKLWLIAVGPANDE